MDGPMIAAMEAELAHLDAKAAAIRSVLSLYKATGSTWPGAQAIKQSSVVTKLPPLAPKPAPDGAVSDHILRVARLLCEVNGEPVPSTAILKAVEEDGVKVAGMVPRNVVSSVLSRSDDFTANGRAGWTLTEFHRADALDENGEAEASPDAEGVAAPSNDAPEEFDL